MSWHKWRLKGPAEQRRCNLTLMTSEECQAVNASKRFLGGATDHPHRAESSPFMNLVCSATWISSDWQLFSAPRSPQKWKIRLPSSAPPPDSIYALSLSLHLVFASPPSLSSIMTKTLLSGYLPSPVVSEILNLKNGCLQGNWVLLKKICQFLGRSTTRGGPIRKFQQHYLCSLL